MNVPELLTLSYLESRSDYYHSMVETWTIISDLAEGGSQLASKREEYLPQRAGEPIEVYKSRLKKFVYRNLLSSSIQQQSSKLFSANCQIDGLEDQFWNEFRSDVDLKSTSEVKFLAQMFRESLKYGSFYCMVDKPRSAFQPRNKAEEKLLQLRPYLVPICPLEVYDSDEDEQGNLTFLKLRQISLVRPNLFSSPLTKCIWTIITPDQILKYSALVKLSNNKILSIVNPDGSLTPVNPETQIPLESATYHNFNQVPVIKFKLPDDLYIANQVYLKCLEHLNLDNCLYDGASLTYIQRTFTPYTVSADDIPDMEGEQQIQSGNPYILKGTFDFKEMSGSALTVLSQILNSLEREIGTIVSQGAASVSNPDPVGQSGISKQVDFSRESIVLAEYGQLITEFYQDCLQLVASSASISDQISVSGFDEFDLDSAESLLAQGDQVEKSQLVPPSAKRLFAKKISSSILKNLNPDQLEQVFDEIDSLTFGSAPINPAAVTDSVQSEAGSLN